MYDRCYDLADLYLSDKIPNEEERRPLAEELAQDIQHMIEDYIEFRLSSSGLP